MLARDVALPARNGRPYRLYCLTDLHIGHVNCDEAGLQEFIAEIADDPDGRCVITGDVVSGIGKGDKRMDISNLADWVLERRSVGERPQDIIGIQVDRAVEILRPIAGQIDGMVAGNHEWKPRSWYGRDALAEIALGLGHPELYLGAQGWVSYSIARTKTQVRTLDVFLHHGTVAGKGGLISMLERVLLDNDCDVAVGGHSHHTLSHSIDQIRKNKKTGKLYQRQRYGIIAGTWQRHPTEIETWADETRQRPAHIGGAILFYNPENGSMKVLA